MELNISGSTFVVRDKQQLKTSDPRLILAKSYEARRAAIFHAIISDGSFWRGTGIIVGLKEDISHAIQALEYPGIDYKLLGAREMLAHDFEENTIHVVAADNLAELHHNLTSGLEIQDIIAKRFDSEDQEKPQLSIAVLSGYQYLKNGTSMLAVQAKSRNVRLFVMSNLNEHDIKIEAAIHKERNPKLLDHYISLQANSVLIAEKEFSFSRIIKANT